MAVSKPTLLLIPGLIGSLEYFDPASRITRADVHTLDLLGYGSFRDVGRDRLTLSAQVGHVTARMESLQRGPLWLCGHSMGGAVAMLVADNRPELVCGIINVEGNFTRKDTFWSSKITAQSPEEWSDQYQAMRQDAAAWITTCGIEPSARRTDWATSILEHQPARTVYAMSEALITETLAPDYLEAVRRVVDRGTPIHLIAGERSAEEWDIPEFIRKTARSSIEIGEAGHLMMLEQPDEFCRAIDTILAPSAEAKGRHSKPSS